MKIRNIAFFSITALVFLIAAYLPKKATTADKEAVLMQTLLGGLNQLHFKPQTINDDFSKKVYKLYLDRVDGGRRFLTQEDIAKLKPFESQIDDQINGGTFEFFNISVDLLDAGIKRAENDFNEVINQPINLDQKESLELDKDKKPFAKNDAELKEYWRKMVKYNVMIKLAAKLDAQEKEKQKDLTKSNDKLTPKGEVSDKEADAEEVETNTENLKDKTYDELLKESRDELNKEFTNFFKRLHKQKRIDRLGTYLNSITNIYDPHTEYFEPVEKDNFDITMSGRLEGIGAKLQTTPDGEFTKVSEIITGGPAWKEKELEAEDVILKVQQEKQEPVDIAGMEINEVVSMIRGPKGTKVTLIIKKKIDSSIKTITILRDEVIIDEGYVKSLLIQDDNSNEKIGYIKLPRFYADFDKADGHQCAKDVGDELEKLKKQNIQGIILDLRNNGGGSLRDVVDMSGYFIEKGPIVQVKARDGKPEILADTDPRVQYNGPLIIMVNEFSASASEIMAAALQDYGRAVIVGTRTYGKGSVQRFFDLDRAIRGFDEIKPLGQVKVTIQKFYRVNGGSTQLEGVTPDIILPDNYYYITVGEKEQDFPMPWDKIDAVPYSQSVTTLDRLPKLVERSAFRQKANETFRLILENAKRIKEQKDETNISLNLKSYTGDQAQDKARAKKFEGLLKPIDKLRIDIMPEDQEAFTGDESKKARTDEWLKDVKKDLYLYETLAIMHDMIKSN